VAREDDPALDPHDVAAFFRHLLRRADWRTDLHFQTRTTIDTLDYSGTGLNEGSKLVIASAGPLRRELTAEVPPGLLLPEGFREPRVCLPGILAIQAPPYKALSSQLSALSQQKEAQPDVARFCAAYRPGDALNSLPLVLLVDDSDFAARSLNNWLWVTFTRSNPAADVHGVGAFSVQKHWGCEGALVIDARIKPHHAPPLVEDAAVNKRVDALAAPGGPLHGIL
jgi:4-hydroxy-3-polyprenylbenzoate decarboxylase